MSLLVGLPSYLLKDQGDASDAQSSKLNSLPAQKGFQSQSKFKKEALPIGTSKQDAAYTEFAIWGSPWLTFNGGDSHG